MVGQDRDASSATKSWEHLSHFTLSHRRVGEPDCLRCLVETELVAHRKGALEQPWAVGMECAEVNLKETAWKRI